MQNIHSSLFVGSLQVWKMKEKQISGEADDLLLPDDRNRAIVGLQGFYIAETGGFLGLFRGWPLIQTEHKIVSCLNQRYVIDIYLKNIVSIRTLMSVKTTGLLAGAPLSSSLQRSVLQ